LLNQDIDKGSIVKEVISIYNEGIEVAKELNNEEKKINDLKVFKELDSQKSNFYNRKEVNYLKTIIENPLILPNVNLIINDIQNLLKEIISKNIVLEIIPTKDYTSISKIAIKYENNGEKTEQYKGNSDGKILYIFHDLSLIVNQNVNKSFNFLVHDSIFDSMEDREERVFNNIKNYVEFNKIQYIFTAIDKQIEELDFDLSDIRLQLTEEDKLFCFNF